MQCPAECQKAQPRVLDAALCICYRLGAGNEEGHQQVYISMSVQVLSFYLSVSNSFCLKYFLMTTP